MKYDPFEFTGTDMKPWERTWRVLFLVGIVTVALMNIFVWNP